VAAVAAAAAGVAVVVGGPPEVAGDPRAGSRPRLGQRSLPLGPNLGRRRQQLGLVADMPAALAQVAAA
jgi:hypothetical protein